jgi:2-polyprenyl-3-methyl-5-hydroxy-6-metoxy-1,4-benzoquinol methylase
MQLEEIPDCPLCGATGIPLYPNLRDKLFQVPGQWSVRRCGSSSCGQYWLDPRLTEEEIYLAYQTYHTHGSSRPQRYGRISKLKNLVQELDRFLFEAFISHWYGYAVRGWRALAWPLLYLLPARRRNYANRIMYLSRQEGGTLLDVGCGSGLFLQRMKLLGWQVQGVEPDPAAARQAREACGLEVFTGTLQQRQLPDDFFDVVVLSHVIEHLHDPAALLREVYRILKRGGRLVLTTPNAESLGSRFFGPDWRGLEIPRHLQIFNLKTLSAMVTGTGFEVCEIGTQIGTGYILKASYALRKNLPFIDARPRIGLLTNGVIKLATECEHLLICCWKNAGEELLLKARK